MGLFDKKFCDVCGEKIGLLGNRKLEDGNLCKDCARKLSPFFSERRSSTVEEIKAQLAYREKNKQLVAHFRPTKDYGFGSTKVYVDMPGRKFIVTSDSTWQDSNPDIIEFSQVLSVNTNIEENKSEIYYQDNEGNDKSYNPPRYECEYEFRVEISVDSPWFNEISLELSNFSHRPESRYSPQYNELEMMMNELSAVLTGQQMPAQPMPNTGYQQAGYNQPMGVYGQPQNMGYQQGTYSQPQYGNQPMYNTQQSFNQAQTGATWFCQNCGTQNGGQFCQSCGAPQPINQAPRTVRCDKCGWMAQPGQPVPRFCPQCGDPVDYNDMR